MGSVEVKDKGWLKILSNLKALDKSYVAVGVLSDAGSYPEGGGVNLASVATFNEFGTGKIPSRPFMRQSFDKNKREISEFKDKQFGEVIEKNLNVNTALERIGVFFKGKVQAEIGGGDFEANSQATIFRKNHRHISKAKAFIEKSKTRKSGAVDIEKFRKAQDTTKTGGKSTPLIDTGRLRQSINFEVKIKF